MTNHDASGSPERKRTTHLPGTEQTTWPTGRTLADELADVATRFGADEEQVRRDHLISHVLAALSDGLGTETVAIFGGTALSRTYLTDVRLSEDIDLLALAPRDTVAATIEATIARSQIRRSHGRPSWRPQLSSTKGSERRCSPSRMAPASRSSYWPPNGYRWPTEAVDLEQRYSDAPPARMRTLTAPAFAAAKLAAWIDRRAPRDLYDLWALSRNGLISPEAADLFTRHGQFTRLPSGWVFDRLPTAEEWQRALGHQTILTVGPREAADAVARAWQTVRG